MPLKGDAAHIPVYAVIAQTEGTRQFFAAQQFAVLHIGALQNIDPVMPAVGFNFSEFETRVSVEHSADHLVENLTLTYPSHTTKGCVPLSSDANQKILIDLRYLHLQYWILIVMTD